MTINGGSDELNPLITPITLEIVFSSSSNGIWIEISLPSFKLLSTLLKVFWEIIITASFEKSLKKELLNEKSLFFGTYNKNDPSLHVISR